MGFGVIMNRIFDVCVWMKAPHPNLTIWTWWGEEAVQARPSGGFERHPGFPKFLIVKIDVTVLSNLNLAFVIY